MALIDDLQSGDMGSLFHSDDIFVPYETGFIPLDYANGFWHYIHDDATNETKKVPVIGIIGGTFVTVIGWPGSGKTTFSDQIAWNIVRKYEDGLMEHIDVEKTALKPRILEIVGAKQTENRIILNKTHTTIDDAYNIVSEIAEKKYAAGSNAKYEIQNAHMFPNEKHIPTHYQPTVIIIDSLYTFKPKDNKDRKRKTEREEPIRLQADGVMDMQRESKEIAAFYNNLLDTLYKYNITIIATNHIKNKIVTDPYNVTPSQLMMMKQNEYMPRGDAPIYLSQNCFRLHGTKSNMYSYADDGFIGQKSTIQIAKTKTSYVGATLNIPFNSDIGFDPIYMLFEFGKDCGVFKGNNPNIRLISDESIKFSRKTFRETYIKNKQFRIGLLNDLRPYLELLLGSKDVPLEERASQVAISDLDMSE